MDRSNKKSKIEYKCITANTSAISQHAAYTTDQLTSPGYIAAIHKSLYRTKNTEEFSGKSSGEWTSRQKRKKKDRVIGLGSRTREEIVK